MKKLAMALWLLQIILVIVMPTAAALEIESILVTGPLLSIVGFLLAAMARRIGSKEVLLYALSGPMICGVGAALIAVNQWSPKQAHHPVSWFLAVCAVVSVALAWFAWRPIWTAAPYLQHHNSAKWQYSLKSMLVMMTAVCVTLVLGRAFYYALPRHIYLIFTGFTVICIALIAFIAYRFYRRG